MCMCFNWLIEDMGKYFFKWQRKSGTMSDILNLNNKIRTRTFFYTMFIIQVTWKAEWVGGLTLETHPASKMLFYRAPTQVQAQLNSLEDCGADTWPFVFLILKHGIMVSV